MFAKFKSGGGATAAPVAPNALESNPIWNHYDVGKQIGTAGPENVWKILEGYRKGDGKEVSIFLFEKRSVEKLHKPKRKEAVAEMLRVGVRHLERFRHPKILQVLHSIEECPETLAFVSEPVLTGLANVHAAMEQKYLTEIASQNSNQQVNHQGSGHQHHQTNQQEHKKPIFPKYYDLLDIELKYGILQVTEALSFLHYSGQVMHRNVCPSNVLITKKGTWKLFGFEFIERVNENDALKPVSLPSWTTRIPKITQPNLDYLAPEVQYEKCGSILSDMYSLGMLICTIFNHGRPLVQANHSASEYHKQIETLEDGVSSILSRIPLPLQEAVTRLLNREQKSRPTAQLLSLIKYFSDPAVHALQFLDVINMKDPTQKSHFYRVTLKEALPYVPRKLWYQHVWPSLVQEASLQESFASVMQPMLYMIQSVTKDEYLKIIYPEFKQLFASPRSIQGSVVLLENLHIILQKTPDDDIGNVLSLFFNGLDCNTIQIQSASFIAVPNVQHYLGNDEVRTRVVPKLKAAFQQNTTDQRILMTALSCILDRLEKQQIIEHILPLLWAAKLDEIEILVRVIGVYRLMLSDKKYGLTINLMATRVMPSLLPQAVNPSLTLEHFTNLFDVLQEMLNHIERNQRNTLKLDNMTLLSPERHRPLRHQYSTDNMHVPPFNIPNLRIEQRKTSSAEDMARKNSIGSMSMTASAENMTRKNSMAGMLGSWWFGGSTSSANADSNFLRVANTFTSRRLSDNTLMTPKIRIAPSCASSPGGTPGGGLPIRRHSSTGPQERRGSNINLSPPTGGGMPITSSSVPYLLSSSLTSVRGSRRPSVSSTSSQQGAGLLQQFGSGMVRQLPPICLNLNGPPPPTLSPSLLQPSGQPSH